MNAKLLLPPAVALALTGLWIGSRHRTLTTLEKETLLLRAHLEAARSDTTGNGDPSLVAARTGNQAARDSDPIDWKSLADSMARAQQGGAPDMRSMMKLQSTLTAMDGTQLIAALDEIAALDLGNDARRGLEEMLIGLLAQKDPKLVLDRFLNKIDDQQSGMAWQLASAFQQWSLKDGAAAVAWFEARIAAGDFESKSLDGKSKGRVQFEAAIVGSLLGSDPAAAGKRIAAMPEDERLDLFQQGMFRNLKPGSEKAFAALIREHVPEAERGTAFSHATAMMVVEGGFEKVGSFLDDIEATPDERRAVAAQAASNKVQQLSHQGTIDRAAIDEVRAWVRQESPDSVDAITGESLGHLWNQRISWEDNARLIEDFHAEGGGDDLLTSFLEGQQAMQHIELAKELAAKIEDETKRARLIARFEGKPVTTEAIAE
jgi:hypothetical protein